MPVERLADCLKSYLPVEVAHENCIKIKQTFYIAQVSETQSVTVDNGSSKKARGSRDSIPVSRTGLAI